MKCFSYILLNLAIVLKLIGADEDNWEHTYIGDICTYNNGNIEMLEAFPWKGSVYIIGQKGDNYRIENFKWDSTHMNFSFGGIEVIDKWNWTSKVQLTFPIDYPGKGHRIIAIELDKADHIEQMVGYLIDLDDHSRIKSKEELNINIYKSGNKSERLNLVTFFAKFPQQALETHLLSVSSFPTQIGKLHKRLFAYYKETPTKSKQKDCNDCYRVKRYVFIARNITYGNNELVEINWDIDNTTKNKCEDLNGLIINASFALTEYFAVLGNPSLYFDWIEFFGTQFNVFRVTMNEMNGLVDIKIMKTDSIGTIFGCQQPTPNITTTTQLQTEGSSRETVSGEPVTEEPFGSTFGTEKLSSPPSPKSSKSGGFVILIIILVNLLVIVIIGVIIWLLLRSKSTPPPTGSRQPPTVPPPSVPVAPTPKPEVTPESSPPTADISEAMITPTPEETVTIRSDLD